MGLGVLTILRFCEFLASELGIWTCGKVGLSGGLLVRSGIFRLSPGCIHDNNVLVWAIFSIKNGRKDENRRPWRSDISLC